MTSLHPYATSQYVSSSNQLVQPTPSPSSLATRKYVTPAPISFANSSNDLSLKKPITSPFKKTFTLPPMFWKAPSRSDSTGSQLPSIPTHLKISSTSNQDEVRNSMISTSSLLLRRSKDLLRRHRTARSGSSFDQQVIQKPRPTIKIPAGLQRSSQDLTITRSGSRNMATSFLDIDEESESCEEEDRDRAICSSPNLSEIETSFDRSLSPNDPKKSPPAQPTPADSQGSPTKSFFSTSTIDSTHSIFSNSLPVTPTTIASIRSPDRTLTSSSTQNPYMDSCIGLLSSLNSLNDLCSDLPSQHRSALNDEIEHWNVRVRKCKITFAKDDQNTLC